MEKANKVVIIDDEQTFLLPLEIGLKRMGIDVVSFTNPLEAIDYLKEHKVNVLLTDYHMEPSINGDEVIKKVREFNKEIIIYLQTGYAETLPAEDMLEKYDIQGYIDKGEGQDKNMQLIKSSLKQADLIEVIKEQKKEISILSYKKAIVGDLISQLANESKDQLFQIGGMVGAIANDTSDYNEEIECIKKATSKINELYDALNFESENTMTIEQFENTIRELLKAKLLIHNAKLSFNTQNKWITIENKANELVYIVIKIIELMLKNTSTDIKFTAEEKENAKTIELSSEKDCSTISIIEVQEMNQNEQIEIQNTDNKIIITIK